MINWNSFLRAAAVIAVCCLGAFADDVPGWLKQAASTQVQPYDKDVPAVVLYKESNVTVTGDKLITTEKYAIRVLTRDGRREAVAIESYLPNFSQVSDMQAWLISPASGVTSFGKKDIIDRIGNTNDIYNEDRVKIIDGSLGADVGYVFGYSLTKEDQPMFLQDNWLFQDSLPTLLSRYTVSVPSGWKAGSVTFNHSSVEPQVNGNTYVWELRGLAPIPREPMSPSFGNLAPRLAVNIIPPDGAGLVNKTFADWSAVARWTSSMFDPQVVIDDNLAGKTRDLTVNAKTEIEIIRAIATFVQNMQYIALDIGLGYGNGMRPRPSNEVLNRGYADCKNKANLMRAMLRVMHIESYPVAIYSGDPEFVRQEFPSPNQFNHCIIAIRVSDATVAPSIINHEKLGRLLIFDATDPYTRVGDLPDQLQGSFAVLAAGDNGGLVRMPVVPPESDVLDRVVEATITENGELKGSIHENATGQASAAFRGEARSLSASDYRKAIEGWLTSGGTGAQLVDIKTDDGIDNFDLKVGFSAPRYAQIMQGRLLIFKPVFVGRHRSIYLTDTKRTHPVSLDSMTTSETATFTLPAGFVVDETPLEVNLDTPFGKYSTHYQVSGDKLIFKRVLSTKRTTVSVDKYDAVRSFFTQIRDAEQTPVVLVRK